MDALRNHVIDHLALFEMRDQPMHHETQPPVPDKRGRESQEHNVHRTRQSDRRDLDPAASPKSTSRCLLFLGLQREHLR